ncbi:carboxypeptidase-like regulatory domain-containing protein [Leptospira brenneri]|nr:carboxypeptidase-like regulatory domain-containing protein [Leptospira brenneri]
MRWISLFFGLMTLSSINNCYFNPIVNGFLNPLEEEKNSGVFWGLLGIPSTEFNITGQLKSNAGVAVVNASIKIKGSESLTSTTNDAGRFHITGPSGSIQLEVNDNGTKFTLDLLVMPPMVSLVTIGNSSYTITNLESYPATSEIPSYFDLVASLPYEGLVIIDEDYMSIFGTGFYFKFSEDLETVADYDQWAAQNFIVSPTISFGSVANSTNAIIIGVAMNTFTIQTDYTLTLMPGIRSVSGKSIKSNTIRFRIESLPL